MMTWKSLSAACWSSKPASSSFLAAAWSTTLMTARGWPLRMRRRGVCTRTYSSERSSPCSSLFTICRATRGGSKAPQHQCFAFTIAWFVDPLIVPNMQSLLSWTSKTSMPSNTAAHLCMSRPQHCMVLPQNSFDIDHMMTIARCTVHATASHHAEHMQSSPHVWWLCLVPSARRIS